MKEIVDLRPNRDLIDNDFSGYKLSLDSIPVYEKSFENAVDTVQPGDDQYSFAHVKLFSLHNHLHFNPHTPDIAYFIDEKWNIMQVLITSMNRIESISRVGEIPRNRERKTGDFPVSVQFASADRAVISDGAGLFHVAAVKRDKWIIVFTDTTLPERSILLSAMQDGPQLYILSCTVVEPKFDSVLKWLCLDENWQILRNKDIAVSGSLQHAAIESRNSFLIITDGRKTPVFIKDAAASQPTENEPKYKWTQTAEDVTIIIDAVDVTEADISVNTTSPKLIVSIKGVEIINGDFTHNVGDVTWRFEVGKIVIRAVKVEAGVGWRDVIEGDANGEQFQSEVVDEEDPSFNAEELEEVDVAAPSALMRLDIDNESISHQVDLSTLQFLFSIVRNPSKPPAICVRHLTDACVWQFETETNSTWQHKHEGTFSAFGYVQASKTQRKFIVAPENLSYVTISDAFSHLYIFRQPSPINGMLRNRTSGTRVTAVAKQQLFNLETSDEVLGIRATNTLILVLTARKFYVLVVNESNL